jgi:predicted kinase
LTWLESLDRRRHNPRVVTVHLIHVYLCSGKTTFARQLEQRSSDVRYSLDEWLTALKRDPVHLDDELYERVYALAMDLWPTVADLGHDVILDFGFWSRQRRDDARARAAAAGYATRLYWVQCPDEVARERCRERNERLSSVHHISEHCYEVLRAKFEPLSSDEAAEVIDCRSLARPTASRGSS